MFSDTELTFRAIQDNVLLRAEHLMFEHIHPDANKRTRDSVDLAHASSERWAQGEQLFNYRAARGFPIDDGEACVRLTKSTSLDKYAVFCLAIKDDFCLYDVMKRLADEGISNFFLAIPDEYWSGQPTPPEDIKQVEEVAEKLKALGVNVHHQVFPVKRHRHPGLKRAEVETLVRNEALYWVRTQGFEHFLIVDGDELWRSGLVKKLDALVNEQHPTAVSCRMVPVIGLPGLPIREAQDKVTIYMRGDVSFRVCRTPYGFQTELPEYAVIHFSATRKSMDEIVRKMTDSGHYDDPAYDFATFIKETLPNVKPGTRDLHMFREFQIWPEAGLWSKSEMEDIPEAMRSFLHDELGPEYTPATRQDALPLPAPGFQFAHAPAVTALHPTHAVTPQGVPKTNHPPRRLRRW